MLRRVSCRRRGLRGRTYEAVALVTAQEVVALGGGESAQHVLGVYAPDPAAAGARYGSIGDQTGDMARLRFEAVWQGRVGVGSWVAVLSTGGTSRTRERHCWPRGAAKAWFSSQGRRTLSVG